MHLMTDPTGRDYLERRSRLAKLLSERTTFRRIDILDDSEFDAKVLGSVLRKVLGREIVIESAKTLMALQRIWLVSKPDLVFLDDHLGHLGRAQVHLPALRRMGYDGPVVVVSGHMTRVRRAEVASYGAAEALHKDDFDTLHVIELLLKLLTLPPPTTPSTLS